ncbi:DgyrCDS9833 [Dimorphilus gyrociliatus]|uniref:DgyrCDS9833 n=1 Tax=Dimorphilus gyrociliatus TaxID=2664684 RepID=A0A7I8VY61_9ANNE|nr:DgyrCDS9833 [Dimorphilus gyrociliatus]
MGLSNVIEFVANDSADSPESWLQEPFGLTLGAITLIINFFTIFSNTLIVVVFSSNTQVWESGRNFYILNLALCDLVIALVSVPLQSFRMAITQWEISIATCLIWNCLDSVVRFEISMTSTILTHDRYKLIEEPLRSLCPERLPFVVFAELYVVKNHIIPSCSSSLLEYFIPVACIVYWNAKLYIKLRRKFRRIHQQPETNNISYLATIVTSNRFRAFGKTSEIRESRHEKSRRAAIVLTMITLAIIIFRTPFFVSLLMGVFCGECVPRLVLEATISLDLALALFNPFIYAYLSGTYKDGCMQMLLNIKKRITSCCSPTSYP